MSFSENRKERLLNRCVDIMLKYPELFEITWILDKASNHLSTKKESEILFWKRESLKSYTGISTVLDTYLKSLYNLEWFSETDVIKQLEVSVVLSTLSEFANKFPTAENRELFHKIKEELKSQ